MAETNRTDASQLQQHKELLQQTRAAFLQALRKRFGSIYEPFVQRINLTNDNDLEWLQSAITRVPNVASVDELHQSLLDRAKPHTPGFRDCIEYDWNEGRFLEIRDHILDLLDLLVSPIPKTLLDRIQSSRDYAWLERTNWKVFRMKHFDETTF